MTDYPCFRFSAARVRSDRPGVSLPLRVLTELTAAGIAYQPRISDGRVFLSSSAGRVDCRDEHTGESLWSFELPGPYRPTARHEGVTLVDQGLVFVRYREELFALDPASGACVERRACPPVSLETGVVLDGVLVAELDDESGSTLVALEVASGEVVWRRGRTGVTPFLSGDDGVVVRSPEAHALAGHDVGSGDEVWRVPVDELGWHRDPVAGESPGRAIGIPSCVAGLAVSGVLESNVVAIDLRTGNVAWQRRVPIPNPFNLTWFVGGTWHLLGPDTLIEFDPASMEFNALHEVGTGLVSAGANWLLAGLAVTDEHVLAADMRGVVVALRRDDGSVDWRADVGGRVSLAYGPLLVGGRVYLLDLDGHLTVFGPA